MTILKRVQGYLGNRKLLLPCSIALSSISAVVMLLPFYFIWNIVQELLTQHTLTSLSDAYYAMGFALLGVLLYYFALMLSHAAAFRVENNIRKMSMKKIIRMPLGFFDNHTSGEIRKVIDDNATITHMFLAHQLPDLAATFVMPILTFVFMWFLDWRLGLACLFPLGLALASLGFLMSKRGQNFTKLYMDQLEKMNTESVEYIRGIPVVKTFQQTVFSFKNFYKSIIDYRDMVITYTAWCRRPMSFYLVFVHSFCFVLVPLTILLMTNTPMSNVTIFTSLLLFVLITPVYSQVVMRSMNLGYAMGQAGEALNRIDEMLDVPPVLFGEEQDVSDNCSVSFKDVSFSYPKTNKKVLQDISFDLFKGQTIALVGPSGGGKTTLAKLIPRFWDADMGSIAIGGKPVKSLSQETLMEYVSFVFQNSSLFKRTLRENVAYGLESCSDAEILSALKKAQCLDIIDKFPEGLDTIIGKNGVYLSGGEQQRICLARAILKDTPLVVLDEATAFSDPENEHLIQQALRELTKGKTVIMVAHRLTSVTDADMILVLDKGRIVERGTHDELLSNKALYTKMWNQYQVSVEWTL
ncbi:ABC transporter ATP-binding protein/permease [Halosquirtibacter laminarini]|uniref:ABC transporter ATP-binding protein/permease n=1 Tax=Halosquirtibacter laminarini TaxID=3374600 RepID=A0AC61NJ75_9BACT|nr:ABC transporter ATP-binding protein/permease [Prolixibacteraceae bacterium]